MRDQNIICARGSTQPNAVIWLVSAGATLAVAIFSFDLWLELGVAAGVPYVVLVCLAYWCPGRRWIWRATAVGVALTLLGFLMSPPGGEIWKVLTNRVLALSAIGVTAVFVNLAKRQQSLLRRKEDSLQHLVARLEQSEEQMRRTFESSPSGMAVVDGRGHIVMANTQIGVIFGFEKEELCGQPIEILLPAEARERHVAYRLEFMRQPQVRSMGGGRQLYGQHKNGQPIAIDVGLNPVRFGEEDCVLVAVVDVTDQKRNEAALARRAVEAEVIHKVTSLAAESSSFEECLKQCLDGICEMTQWPVGHAYFADRDSEATITPAPIWHLADQVKYRRFVEVSEATWFAWGSGLAASVVQTGEPAWVADIQDDVAWSQTKVTSELNLCGAFGFPVVVSGETVAVLEFFTEQPLEPDSHLLSLVQLIGIQLGRVVERQRAHMDLQNHAEAVEKSNRELTQFAYVASHDLQEPLRKMSSYAHLLLEDCGDNLSDDGREYLGIMIDGASRLKKLVTDLLHFSRINSHGKELAPTGAEESLKMALSNMELLLEETNADVSHDTLPFVMADASQLTALFQNLIGNAIKYCKETPKIHVGVRDSADSFEFSVRDNGIGIEPQYFERIFGIFKRLHSRNEYSGTGIGLANCQRIVERFGGRIWVESTPGEGSVFYFTIKKAKEREPTICMPIQTVHDQLISS